MCGFLGCDARPFNPLLAALPRVHRCAAGAYLTEYNYVEQYCVQRAPLLPGRELEVTGQPAATGYCHCKSCRSWSAAPVNAFTLWEPSAVAVTRGQEHVASFAKTECGIRKWRKGCGGHLLTEHPTFGLIDVYAAALPTLPFQPMLHVSYEDSVLRLHDGLPKQRDFPKEMGGSGNLLPE